jgi:hypothetical protein
VSLTRGDRHGHGDRKRWVGIPSGRRYSSVWRKLLDAVVEPQPRNAEHEIAEYLYRHRYDLPPEVWIELERRRLGP